MINLFFIENAIILSSMLIDLLIVDAITIKATKHGACIVSSCRYRYDRQTSRLTQARGLPDKMKVFVGVRLDIMYRLFDSWDEKYFFLYQKTLLRYGDDHLCKMTIGRFEG